MYCMRCAFCNAWHLTEPCAAPPAYRDYRFCFVFSSEVPTSSALRKLRQSRSLGDELDQAGDTESYLEKALVGRDENARGAGRSSGQDFKRNDGSNAVSQTEVSNQGPSLTGENTSDREDYITMDYIAADLSVSTPRVSSKPFNSMKYFESQSLSHLHHQSQPLLGENKSEGSTTVSSSSVATLGSTPGNQDTRKSTPEDAQKKNRAGSLLSRMVRRASLSARDRFSFKSKSSGLKRSLGSSALDEATPNSVTTFSTHGSSRSFLNMSEPPANVSLTQFRSSLPTGGNNLTNSWENLGPPPPIPVGGGSDRMPVVRDSEGGSSRSIDTTNFSGNLAKRSCPSDKTGVKIRSDDVVDVSQATGLISIFEEESESPNNHSQNQEQGNGRGDVPGVLRTPRSEETGGLSFVHLGSGVLLSPVGKSRKPNLTVDLSELTKSPESGSSLKLRKDSRHHHHRSTETSSQSGNTLPGNEDCVLIYIMYFVCHICMPDILSNSLKLLLGILY